MRLRLPSILIAALLLASVAVPVLAHHPVLTGCGQVSFDSSKDWTVRLMPGPLTFGPFAHDGVSGPYPIAAGVWSFTFRDAAGHDQETGSFEVPPCQQPTPSPAASPTPTPTPDPTRTPDPSATPTATPTATGTPIVTATPTFTSRPACAGSGHQCQTPPATLPPTASADQVGPADPDPDLSTFALLLFGLGMAVIIAAPRIARRLDR